jgi:hypothetical protein
LSMIPRKISADTVKALARLVCMAGITTEVLTFPSCTGISY